MKLGEIKRLAEALTDELRPFCKRIEIAGSIRREKPECKDIEIVCIADSWKLAKYLIEKRNSGTIFKKNGPKYKQFLYEGVWVDLFITNEEFWGLIFLIRTGSADFNIRWLTYMKKMHPNYKIDGGVLYKVHGSGYMEPISVKEEQVIFDLLNMDFIQPKDRI